MPSGITERFTVISNLNRVYFFLIKLLSGLLIFESMLKVASCVLFVHKTCQSTKQLVFCVFSVPKDTLCICVCVRPVEVPGSLSFVFLLKLVKGKAEEKKIHLLLVEGKVTCFKCPLVNKLSHGMNSTQCTRACVVIAFGYVCQLVFWVELPCTPWVSAKILCWSLFHSGAAVLGPNNLWSTPPPSKNHIERIPLNVKTE